MNNNSASLCFRCLPLSLGVVGLLGLSGIAITVPAYAAGNIDLRTWLNTGDVSFDTSSTQVDLLNGSLNSLAPGTTLSGNPAIGGNELTGFLGSASGSLNLGGTASSGSALKSSLTVNAGDKFSFDWFFAGGITQFPDYAFLKVNDEIVKFADALNVAPDPNYSPSYSGTADGKYSYVFKDSGNFNVALGVVKVGNGFSASGVGIDKANLEPVPEPTSILGSLLATGVGAFARFRKKQANL